MSNNKYQIKYLKYKNKYLELKNFNMTGGNLTEQELNELEKQEQVEFLRRINIEMSVLITDIIKERTSQKYLTDKSIINNFFISDLIKKYYDRLNIKIDSLFNNLIVSKTHNNLIFGPNYTNENMNERCFSIVFLIEDFEFLINNELVKQIKEDISNKVSPDNLFKNHIYLTDTENRILRLGTFLNITTKHFNPHVMRNVLINKIIEEGWNSDKAKKALDIFYRTLYDTVDIDKAFDAAYS
jgi:hypothetical protein